ncbi:hypothetical protein ABW19_dt0205639 [Dactylella cylindrospora]|nr:hypothetical protein ABW19_dt0205639 [Dactylella cylindrospora]
MSARQPGDRVIWPIFKIGDFGGASDNKTVSSERIKSRFTIPSVPKDDIYALGAMMFLMSNKTVPYAGKRTIHYYGGDGAPRPICNNQSVEHVPLIPATFDGKWSQCLTDILPTYERENEANNPYADWWNQLVGDCVDLKRAGRPDAVDVIRRIWNGVQVYGIGDGGSRKVLWDHSWLGFEVEELDEFKAPARAGCALL